MSGDVGRSGCECCSSSSGRSVPCTEGHWHTLCGTCRCSILYVVKDSDQFVCPDSLDTETELQPAPAAVSEPPLEGDDEDDEEEDLPL